MITFGRQSYQNSQLRLLEYHLLRNSRIKRLVWHNPIEKDLEGISIRIRISAVAVKIPWHN